MNILVTGAKGFVGRNLVTTLDNIKAGRDKSFNIDFDIDIYEYDVDTEQELLDEYCKKANFVFNLAGVNRPLEESEFMKGNFGFASELLDTLKKYNNKCPIVLSSSIQAELDNPYGKSKKAGEDLFFQYAKENDVKVYVYRFPNVFGKWCRPNYNSAIATFCHNIANDLEIKVNDRSTLLTLVYIDDVVNELISALKTNANIGDNGFCSVPVIYKETLGTIVDMLYSFKESRMTKNVPNTTDDCFEKKLYSTYLSYLPTDEFSYFPTMNVDERGSFTELIRTKDRGQFSVNITKPGIMKGQHWHHSKNEKFVVVSGQGLIKFRKIGETEVHEYYVSGDKIEIVDIPTGYTHSIENVGETDLVTFMWANECFNPDKPDTYFEPI